MKSKLSAAASVERFLRIAPAPDLHQRRFHATFERHLADLLMSDEPAAASGMWDHFSPLVRGLVTRTLGPWEASEPAVQAAFLCIYRRRRQLAVADRLRPFVLNMTIRQLRWHLRKRRWHRAVARLLGTAAGAPEQPGAHPLTPHRLALADLYRALDDLGAGERLAFALHFFEGIDLAEAAALANTTPPVFERRLRAARDKLRASGLIDLGEDGEDDRTLQRLGRLARAASSRPVPSSTARASRTHFLDRIARRSGEA